MVPLVARRALAYGGRQVRAGEVFEARPLDAAVLTYHRTADFAPVRPVPASSPARPVEPEASAKPARRRYRRRDLRAED